MQFMEMVVCCTPCGGSCRVGESSTHSSHERLLGASRLEGQQIKTVSGMITGIRLLCPLSVQHSHTFHTEDGWIITRPKAGQLPTVEMVRSDRPR